METYYTVTEFAELLQVNRQTVYQWIYRGQLASVQVTPRGARRIPASELERIKQQRSD